MALLQHYPREELLQNMTQIFSLLFQRLSLSKTTKFVKGLIVFLCYYAVEFGGDTLANVINSLQSK